MKRATLLLFACAVLAGVGVLLGWVSPKSLVPPFLLGATMMVALLDIVVGPANQR